MKKYHYITPFILQKIAYVLTWILLKFFVRLDIRGEENLKSLTGPLILAANHAHELDPTIFALVLPLFSKHFPIYFVSNPEEKFRTFGWRSYFYGGAFFNMLGAYPIISGKHNYGIALQSHIDLLRKGQTVCIFPEGRRTKDGNLQLAHGGIGYMSYITQASVVPIAVNTFFDMNFKDFILRQRKVVVTVGAPMASSIIVPENNPTVTDFKKGGQRVMDEIGRLMTKSQ
jgi:1-acyl-sn-glycerol-3-phosphate acyltransferase